MSDSVSRIISSNRAHPLRLAAIWLFLLALPALVLIIAFDQILLDSEKHLSDQLKTRMMNELRDFREKMSFSAMIGLKLQKFAARKLKFNSAEELDHSLAQHTALAPCATFFVDSDNQQLTWLIEKSVQPVFGIISKTMLRNYLLYLIDKEAKDSDATFSEVSYNRSRAYLRTLLATAEYKLRTNQPVPALSGKPELNRLVIWFMPISDAGGALLIFREIDISLSQLAEFAKSNRLYHDLQREYVISGEGRKAIYRQGREMMEFSVEADKSLSLKGMISEEALLRLVTKGSYFPVNLKEVKQRLPLLKISAPVAAQQHPLRRIFDHTILASLIMVVLATILLLRIQLFGYGSGLNIRSRLLICVAGASILPFSTFIAGVVYHESFSEEFERAEIAQYLNLQLDFVNKSISARIELEERKLADLSETLGRLDQPESLACLTEWQKKSPAALVLYQRSGTEYTFTTNPEEHLNQTEIDMKKMAFMSMENALGNTARKDKSTSTLGALGFKVKGLSLILENVGRLYDAMTDQIVCIFSSFPVYSQNQRFSAPEAYLMIKYYTYALLNDCLKQHPEFLKPVTKGDYLIQTCFLPVKDPAVTPSAKDALMPSSFVLSPLQPLIRRTMRSRSKSEWSDSGGMALAGYHHRLHCIILLTATPLENRLNGGSKVALSALLYFTLITLTLVVFLSKILIEPIDMLKQGAKQVELGQYQQKILLTSGDEFEPLTESFNAMTAGLYQKELLSSYVSQDVLDEVSSDVSLIPGGERVDASVVFCALKGFRELSQQSNPEQTVEALGRLIEIADNAAVKHGGVMDKLIEDTVMLVFRKRSSDKDYSIAACRAALEINQAFAATDRLVKVGTGIASGSAVSGKIGSKTGKLDFTLIGNPVNLAARLKAQAHKADNTGIIVCPATIRLLKGRARLRFIERTEIKGRSRTFPLYELLELRD